MRSRWKSLLAVVGGGAALAVTPIPGAAQGSQPVGGNCVECHAALGGTFAAPVEAYAEDIHAVRGFGCVACHGGDETAAGMEGMSPARGFVGRPRGRQLLTVCGRCHSDAALMRQYNPSLRVDQVQEYLTSGHGQRLARTGDDQVAVCSSCHPAHSVKPPSDPASSVHPLNVAATCGACHSDPEHMSAYGIATEQREQYERSIHFAMMEGGDLSAPTCNDCHGNHGAAPPGVSSVGNVCGQCHAVMAGLFRGTRHAEVFAMMGSPGCATCHGNHEVLEAGREQLGLEEGTFCSRCHTDAEGDRGGQAAIAMRQLVDSLYHRFTAAHELLERAERAGMEVSQAMVDLESVNNAQVAARAAVHAFNVAAVQEKVEEGLAVAEVGYVAGEAALAELGFRRTGLAISVGVILVLIVGLVIKIRQLEA